MAGDKVEQSRWVVPARSSHLLVMQFQSEDMGTFKENLVFEVCPLTLPILVERGPVLEIMCGETLWQARLTFADAC